MSKHLALLIEQITSNTTYCSPTQINPKMDTILLPQILLIKVVTSSVEGHDKVTHQTEGWRNCVCGHL